MQISRYGKNVLTALCVLCLLSGFTAEAKVSVCSVDQATLVEKKSITPQISTDELRHILRQKTATVFDARPYREYAVSHIPGALSLAPKPGVEKAVYVSDTREISRIVHGDKAASFVLYCNGRY